MPKRYLISIAGFTVLELVMVVLIIGIIGVVALPKWTGTATNVSFEAKRVLNDIRYAQALSTATGQRYRWVKTSSNTYQVLNESGSAITLPMGGTTMTFTSGATFGTLTNLPNSLIAFDSQGAPYTTTSIPGTALAATATIPVTASGQTRTISISPQTGYGVMS